MDAGVVMECQLHKIVFTTSVKKYSEYNSEEHTLPVRVPFAYLESILIPIDEPQSAPPSRDALLGTIPLPFEPFLKYKSVNQDPMLQGAQCCIERSGARVFWKGRQK